MTTLAPRDILEQGIIAARMLLAALEKEHDALLNNDFDILTASLEHKQGILLELQSIGSQLEKRGVQNKKNLSSAGYRYSNTTALWDEFRQLLRQSRHQNNVNGRIVHMRQHSTHAALAILRGQERTDQTAYSANGKAISTSSPSRIATA